MPFVIKKQKPSGFKVCKKGTSTCYSKKPLTKKMATKQRTAINLSEMRQVGKGLNVNSVAPFLNIYPLSGANQKPSKILV